MDEPILVVDHVEDRREHLVSMLQEQDLDVTQASSCEDCLNLLRQKSFPVILSETDLPRKSGLFLLKEAKSIQPQTEVILLTHNASSFTLLQAIRHGAYDFILRPIDSSEILFNTLCRALDHIRQRAERDNLLHELESKNRSLNSALHRLKTLTEDIKKMAESDQVEEIFRIMLHAATTELHAGNGLIALFNRDNSSLALKMGEKISAETCGNFSRRLPDGLIQVIAKRSKPVLIPSRLPQGLANLKHNEEDQLLKLPGLVSVPLQINNRSAGLMLLSGHPPKLPFAEHDLLYLRQLAVHSQLLLEKAGQIHLLRRNCAVSA
ncbi:GAF domain-containing protein [Malonomonas rubra DSM 5091]|uniref:GAF domain-containing protein n=1 Tax=Malonomonas rubra DSM 5091 TaxID=1122189 RepID=A0A1M6BAS2_MALRU|nr:response regulator [Malonomonas rubra]SHI45786.1 GAF domain-containing protein [Malonomonas rubra DSM 5091]